MSEKHRKQTLFAMIVHMSGVTVRHSIAFIEMIPVVAGTV